MNFYIFLNLFVKYNIIHIIIQFKRQTCSSSLFSHMTSESLPLILCICEILNILGSEESWSSTIIFLVGDSGILLWLKVLFSRISSNPVVSLNLCIPLGDFYLSAIFLCKLPLSDLVTSNAELQLLTGCLIFLPLSLALTLGSSTRTQSRSQLMEPPSSMALPSETRPKVLAFFIFLTWV